MNRDIVETLVRPRLSDIELLENKEILKGKFKFNSHNIGTYFIDFSQAPITDLRGYQENNIAQYYYETPGADQWNYYLIFLRENYDIELKRDVERDGVYTRKFVFTPQELENYFNYTKAEKKIETDIVSGWKEKLRAVGLDEVYATGPYTQAIDRFLNNTVERDLTADNKINAVQVNNLSIKRLSRLDLKENYRSHPKWERAFNFGQVNLIKGVNATGKTSLLEAIESVITGGTLRNLTTSEPNESISAVYNNLVPDTYEPHNYSKYRERDTNWYGSGYTRGNELPITFGRYNFYDSDAAYKLSINNKVDTLSKALTSIALGSEFTRIQERLKGFRDRLSKELTDRQNVILQARSEIDTANSTIKKIKQTEDPATLFSTFVNFAAKIGWKAFIPHDINSGYPEFEASFNSVQSAIQAINRVLISGRLRTYSGVVANTDKLKAGLEQCREIRRKQVVRLGEKDDLDIRQNSIVSLIALLESINKYYRNESSFSLLGLDKRIETLESGLRSAQEVKLKASLLSNPELLDSKLTITELKTDSLGEIDVLRSLEQEKENELRILKSDLSELESLTTEIKSLGKQFVLLNNSATDCPLCAATYSHEDLVHKISKVSKIVGDIPRLSTLDSEIIEIKNKINLLDNKIREIAIFDSILNSNFPELNSDFTPVETLKRRIDSLLASSVTEGTDLEMLQKLKSDLMAKGLSEGELIQILDSMVKTFPEFKFVKEGKLQYEELVEVQKKNLVEVREAQENWNVDIARFNSELKQALENIAPTIAPQDFESDLTYRIETLQTVINAYQKIQTDISIPDDKDINEVAADLEQLYKHFHSVRQASLSLTEIQLANQLLATASEKISIHHPIAERLEPAVSVCNDILDNFGAGQILRDFLEKNEVEILDIFEAIHTPREFNKIVFDKEQNTLFLQRENETIPVSLSKISTGQRTALALSIFIALNKKLSNGPSVILFDDPITYTDDLNVLSFLDYLRLMVVNENRQIFFATANQKFAGLIEKKFQFLGEQEFKVFTLRR